MEQKEPDQKMIEMSQKHYSEEGLWDKVMSVAKKAGVEVIYLALVLYYTATADTTPAGKKGIIYGALGYFILPIDLVPDVILGIGYTDDMAALGACAATVATCITPAIKQQAHDRLHDWFGDFSDKEIKNLL